MARQLNRIREATSALWRVSPPLTAVAAAMLVMLVVSVVGLFVDPRVITGAPAWLKPAKFAISTAIYSLTLAWVFRSLPAWPRMRAIVGWTTAIVFVVEVAIIDVQAWRGTTSHFNVSTTLDAVLFSVMGTLILAQTLASVATAVALWRQRHFEDQAIAWAMRIGMVLTIAGAATGGLMTRPTAAQLEQARLTHAMSVAGAHTVGAPDGGPGIPGTGWSREHGDVRVPHFVGLHALQLLPLLALFLRRRGWPEALRVRAMVTGGVAYAGLFLILLTQALRGQSMVQPDAITIALAAGLLASTTAAWIVRHGRRAVSVPAVL
jgi:hypothetical protein